MTPYADVKVCLFDMDHTLINADCDVNWKYFAVKHGLAGKEALTEADRFFEDYCRGELKLHDFFAFQFREFTGLTQAEIEELSQRHFEEYARSAIYRDALSCVQKARAAGKTVGILSSTNTLLTRPVAQAFGIDLVLGTQLEFIDGRCTGQITGTYAVGEGKVTVAEELAQKLNIPLSQFAYYGDSINDRFILEASGRATAVNPSGELRHLAMEKQWNIETWN